MMTSLKSAYANAGQTITTQPQIKNLLNTQTGSQTTALGSTIITTQLGGNAAQVPTNTNTNALTCSGTAPVQITGMTISTTAPTASGTLWTYSGTTSAS